jgi:pyrimidine operon attenuation protein/uracil phosphoribosyltransferase
VAETSSIEHLSKTNVSASIEVYGRNATLANFPDVVGNGRTVRAKLTRILDSETSNTSRLITKYKIYHESNKMRIMW